MSDGEGLLWDIMENPDDDVPRLVLADWLDEHGQHERAELVRVHLAAVRRNPKCSKVLVAGSTRLDLRTPHEQLIERLFHPLRHQIRCCVVRRGFPEEAELRFTCWPQFAPTFWNNPVRHLWLKQVSGRSEALLESGLLGRVLSIVLGEMTSDDVCRLSEGPPLPRLRFLCLHQQRMVDHIRLLSSGVLPPPRAIELGGVSSPTEKAIFPAGFVFRAKSFCSLGSSLHSLASQPFLASVRRLRLACSSWFSGTVEALAASPHLAKVEELELPGGGLDDDQLAVLLRAPWLRNLRSLDLRRNHITSAGGLLLASSQALSGLCSLTLWGNRLTRGSWRRLEERFGDRLVGRDEINRLYEANGEPFINPV